MAEQWYFAETDKGYGPFSFGQLRQLALAGILHPTDLVWQAGASESEAAGKVQGLFASVRAEPSRPQPPALPQTEPAQQAASTRWPLWAAVAVIALVGSIALASWQFGWFSKEQQVAKGTAPGEPSTAAPTPPAQVEPRSSAPPDPQPARAPETVKRKEVTEARLLRGHTDYVFTVAFSPDSKKLVSGGHDKTVRLWDVDTQKELSKFSESGGRIGAVALSRNGRFVASASEDGTIRLLDATSLSQIRAFQGHREALWNLVFGPDGTTLYSAGRDQTIRQWDIVTGKELASWKGDTGVRAIALSSDGTILAATGKGRAVLWNTGSGQIVSELPVVGAPLSFAFSPGGDFLAATVAGREVVIWDVATKQVRSTLKGTWSPLHVLSLHPKGRLLATTSSLKEGDGMLQEVKLFDVESGQELTTVHKYKDRLPVLGLAFSPDGSTLALGKPDGSIALIDVTEYARR